MIYTTILAALILYLAFGLFLATKFCLQYDPMKWSVPNNWKTFIINTAIGPFTLSGRILGHTEEILNLSASYKESFGVPPVGSTISFPDFTLKYGGTVPLSKDQSLELAKAAKEGLDGPMGSYNIEFEVLPKSATSIGSDLQTQNIKFKYVPWGNAEFMVSGRKYTIRIEESLPAHADYNKNITNQENIKFVVTEGGVEMSQVGDCPSCTLSEPLSK